MSFVLYIILTSQAKQIPAGAMERKASGRDNKFPFELQSCLLLVVLRKHWLIYLTFLRWIALSLFSISHVNGLSRLMK